MNYSADCGYDVADLYFYNVDRIKEAYQRV